MSRPDISHLTTEQQFAIMHLELEATKLALRAHGRTGPVGYGAVDEHGGRTPGRPPS